jgi:hypothetical protein
MPGARCTHSLACKVKKHTSVITTGTPNWSGLPCALVLTAYNVLSPVTGSFATVACASYRRLDSSVGAPGPHALAVRVSATRQRHLRVHRIPSRVS